MDKSKDKNKDKEKEKEEKPIFDREEQIRQNMEPQLDKQIEELLAQKNQLKEETAQLQATISDLTKRNENIVNQMIIESAEFSKRVEEQGVNFENTKKECEKDIEKIQEEINVDFQAARKVLIDNRKKCNHLVFNLNEKKEVDENRKQLLAQREKLKQEYDTISKELDLKREQNLAEIYNKRDIFKSKAKEENDAAIEKAKEEITQEKNDTLRVAQAESKTLSKLVVKAQKAVVQLRDQYNKLLEEANNLEMQLMEAKLVTQLTTPEKNQQTIQNLIAEKDKLEDERIKARTKPEADGRRQLTQHLNLMKKKSNELNGFIKLNQLKLAEMQQLRALAMNVIEQRNTLMTFMNETITKIRKEIASAVNQKGLNFRTSELILCHLADDESQYGSMFNDNVNVQELSEQLRFFEVLYSRFTGISQPRKIDETL